MDKEKKHTKPTQYLSELLCEMERLVKFNSSDTLEVGRRALPLAEELGDKQTVFHIYKLKGVSLTNLGEFSQGRKWLYDALDLVERHFLDDYNKYAIIYNVLGYAYSYQGKIDVGLEYLLKVLTYHVPEQRVMAYNNIADIYIHKEEYRKAKKYLDIGLEEACRMEYYFTPVGVLLLNSLECEYRIGSGERALELLDEAADKAMLYGLDDDKYFGVRIQVLVFSGGFFTKERRYDRALEVFDKALELSRDYSIHANYYCGIMIAKADTLLEMGQRKDGLELVGQVLEYADRHGLKDKWREMMRKVVAYHEASGDLEAAYPLLRELENRKMKENQLEREERFRKIITEREREISMLESKNKVIKEQNELLERFAYDITQNLQSPIEGVNSFSSLLEEKYRPRLDGNGQEFLGYMTHAAFVMRRNLERLLEFSKLDEMAPEDRRRVAIRKVVDSVVGQKSKTQKDMGCDLEIQCNDILVDMVPRHARILFDELVSNAIRFKKRHAPCRIEISGTEKGGQQIISVKDYGIGIKPEYIHKIFRMYNRLDRKNYDGAGVGLTICQRIVWLYHGRIWLESDWGEYTVVKFSIPLITDVLSARR